VGPEPRGFHAFYRAALPLSSRGLTFVAGIIRCHQTSIGPRWRKLNPGEQALLVLALHKGETFAELAAGFAVGVTTAWRSGVQRRAGFVVITPSWRVV